MSAHSPSSFLHSPEGSGWTASTVVRLRALLEPTCPVTCVWDPSPVEIKVWLILFYCIVFLRKNMAYLFWTIISLCSPNNKCLSVNTSYKELSVQSASLFPAVSFSGSFPEFDLRPCTVLLSIEFSEYSRVLCGLAFSPMELVADWLLFLSAPKELEDSRVE